MDNDGGLDIRNWGYYEQPMKGNLGLQLMSTVSAERDSKPPIMVTANGSFLHRGCTVSEAPRVSMEFIRENWINQRENKIVNVLPANPNYSVMPESSGTHPMQILQPPDSSKGEERMVPIDEGGSKKDNGPLKKRKVPRTKKSKKGNTVSNNESDSSAPSPNPKKKIKNTGGEVSINGVDLDVTCIPTPVCSCTGAAQQCYRWGCGGWQSACCTTTISMYPLPMSTKRRSARIAGRKMSQGAFKKVLEKVAAEGHDLTSPIDLRTHWAKHGTNKFVTIK
eukprot:TRINITY_DN3671_c0_g1_i1.p1 TRINITY_DN3671_c0_g1~~TRINITY_DN3671_c0_g1_i1.p1  ORF type:complete len:279 (-),score=21.05 TRINITY_DN3671_c0_g1_i1:213-1049(-)